VNDYWWLLIAAAFILLGLLYADALHDLGRARRQVEKLRSENFALQQDLTSLRRLRTALTHQTVPRRVPGQRRRSEGDLGHV